MVVLYVRQQRESINHPATINDLPPEVLRKCFMYLLPRGRSDLAASSSVSRSWRPIAQGLLANHSPTLRILSRMQRRICGLALKSIVFGFEEFAITSLILEIRSTHGEECARLVVKFISPTLVTLQLKIVARGGPYDYIGFVAKHCLKIRNLRLDNFRFGTNPGEITQPIKKFFARLKQLSLSDSEGDVKMFIDQVPIPGLQTFNYEARGFYEAQTVQDIVLAVAMKYPTLIAVKLYTLIGSSVGLLKIVECCPSLEKLIVWNMHGSLKLKVSDIDAFASLDRLKVISFT
jgi:hypothetical protein